MKVHVNSTYRFQPIGCDKFSPCGDLLKPDDLVQVINLPGCPPANTMGQCYVRLVGDSSKAFQMVSTDSLEPLEVRQ
jgi:hypothetical protein